MAVPRQAYSRNLKRLYDWLTGLNKGKVANQTVTGSTTLVVDDTMSFTMEANRKYRFKAIIFFDTTANADFKWRHAGPASPTRVGISKATIIPGATAYSNIGIDVAYSAADNAETGTNAGTGVVELDGIIHNGANAGDFQFKWSQNTSDGGNTIVLAGSYISWELVA